MNSVEERRYKLLRRKDRLSSLKKPTGSGKHLPLAACPTALQEKREHRPVFLVKWAVFALLVLPPPANFRVLQLVSRELKVAPQLRSLL